MASNVEIVGAIYQAFQAGDIPAILQRLAPSCEWEHDSVDYGIPWLTPRVGPAQVARFFEDLAAIEFHSFEVRNLLAGGDQVAGVVYLDATVRATGKRVRDLEIHLFTFDSNGLVIRFRHSLDTLQHHAATLPLAATA
jgi:ketosteroid isomerase-like protein